MHSGTFSHRFYGDKGEINKPEDLENFNKAENNSLCDCVAHAVARRKCISFEIRYFRLW